MSREFRESTPETRAAHQKSLEEANAALPEFLERAERRRAAMAQQNVSGQLRRAIAEDGFQYDRLAKLAGITTQELADFMTGDIALSSTVVDRLAEETRQKLVSAG